MHAAQHRLPDLPVRPLAGAVSLIGVLLANVRQVNDRKKFVPLSHAGGLLGGDSSIFALHSAV